jgi:hypothetical protein
MKTINRMKTLLLIFLPFTLFSQIWYYPVNISPNLPGLDNQPDLCIDKNGTLHCVFTHKLASNWRKIYYSKSSDDGATWTTPEDISLNPDTSLMNPHIVADTNNILYVSYDYNTGNPAMTMIYLKTYDGSQWSEPFIVSEGLYNSHHNLLAMDYKNRLYVFWNQSQQLPNYRYFENNTWSEFITPYPGNNYLGILDITVDNANNLQCIGMFREEGQTPDEDKVVYFKFEEDNDWSDLTILSAPTVWLYGNEIDVDNQNNPHVAYRRKQPNTGPDDDSTMYRYYDGNWWSLPELVISDPCHQRIAIDPYNRVHIFDKEKLETGSTLIHYQRIDGFWEGYLLDSSSLNISNPDIMELNNNLYLTYYKCFSDSDCKIRFMKNHLLTDIQQTKSFLEKICIYPNPFKTQTTIEFELTKERQMDISIYDLHGQKITTLMNENKKPGVYRLIWNGKDLNGKEVNTGIYLVRLQSGRNIVTQPVEIIK